MSSAAEKPATGTSQVVRLLGLMPYIARRPGITVSALAAEFGVSEKQITADLNLLMLCGEPGYYPHELIDMTFDESDGRVAISYDAGLDRPVTLTSEEALTLTVALQALAATPGLVDTAAVHSALAKISDAVAITIPTTLVPEESQADYGPILRTAIADQHRVQLRYFSAWRDTVSDRQVDPLRLLAIDGRTYLEGFCYQAEDIRRFRLDRMDDVQVLDQKIDPQRWHQPQPVLAPYTPRDDVSIVTLALAPAASWVAEYYHMSSITYDVSRPGWITAQLSGGNDDWIIRLVLSLGGSAIIVDRPELASAVAARAQAALAGYRRG